FPRPLTHFVLQLCCRLLNPHSFPTRRSSDLGTIAAEKEIKIGFLKQDIDFVKGRTVLEEAYEAFEEIRKAEKKIDEINNQLVTRSEEHTSELQSRENLVCRLLLEKKKKKRYT